MCHTSLSPLDRFFKNFTPTLLTFSFCLIIFDGTKLGCHGARILFYNVVATTSHNMIMHPLATKLVDIGGHEVTFLSSIKLKKEHPKISYLYPEKVVQFMSSILSQVGTADDDRKADNAYNLVIPLAAETCRLLMVASHEIPSWIDRSSFDLVVINGCYNECGLGFAHAFKAPHVIVQTAPFAPWHADLWGLPVESSTIPDFRLKFSQNMNFFQRLYNTLYSLEMYIFKLKGSFFLETENYLRDGLKDPQMPDIGTMAMGVRLVLINSYFAAEYAHSLPPFVVPVGGLHCQDDASREKLPENVENFVSKFENDQGFIFVSFGTMSRPSPQLETGLLKSLPKKFPRVGFVIKWAGKLPQDHLNNVLPVSWVPQQAILAHSAVKAFVSHCGMLSIQEAAHYGVPVIAMPGRADQDYNAECLVRLGVAVRLEVIGLETNQLEAAVEKILYDKTYTEKMKGLSEIYRDRPMPPMETAIWWLEFVIRNKKKGNDLSNILSPGIYQTWWQRRLLDVWALIFVLLGLILILLFKLLNFGYHLFIMGPVNGRGGKKLKSS